MVSEAAVCANMRLRLSPSSSSPRRTTPAAVQELRSPLRGETWKCAQPLAASRRASDAAARRCTLLARVGRAGQAFDDPRRDRSIEAVRAEANEVGGRQSGLLM